VKTSERYRPFGPLVISCLGSI